MGRTLFIDSTADIDALWRRVHGAADIAIDVAYAPMAEADIPARVAGFDTLIVDATYFSEATLKRCTGLKHIVFLGTGAGSFIDLGAAARQGIKVSTIKGYGDTAVAEHAMALVFAAARNIAAMHTRLREGGWQVLQGVGLRGKTLGLVGLGHRRVAVAFDGRHLDALAAGTRHFLDRERLGMLKPGAILVNTARASLVDEAALADLLRANRIGHYATDVYIQEPPAANEPLRTLARVTLTAHAAYNTPEAAMTMYRRAIDLAAAGW